MPQDGEMQTETRRLVKVGGSRMISIPPDWLRDNHLEEAKTVSLETKGGRLVIFAEEIEHGI